MKISFRILSQGRDKRLGKLPAKKSRSRLHWLKPVPRVYREVLPSELPPIEKLEISAEPTVEMKLLGKVTSFVECLGWFSTNKFGPPRSCRLLFHLCLRVYLALAFWSVFLFLFTVFPWVSIGECLNLCIWVCVFCSDTAVKRGCWCAERRNGVIRREKESDRQSFRSVRPRHSAALFNQIQ